MLAQTTLRDRFGQGGLRDALRHLPGAHDQKKHGRGGSSFATDGMDEAAAQEYRRVKDELSAKYPSTADVVSHWGTFDDPITREAMAKNCEAQAKWHDEKGRSYEAGMLRESATVLRDPDATGGQLDRAWTIGAGNNLPSGINLRDADGSSVIAVNPRWMRPDAESSRWPGLGQMEQTITHEFGHAMEHRIVTELNGVTPLGTRGSTMDGFRTINDAAIRVGRGPVSKYGGTNAVEGFAESFVAYHFDITGPGETLGGRWAPAKDRMASFLDLVDEASVNQWPKWGDRGEDHQIQSLRWISTLNDLGPDPIIPWSDNG